MTDGHGSPRAVAKKSTLRVTKRTDGPVPVRHRSVRWVRRGASPRQHSPELGESFSALLEEPGMHIGLLLVSVSLERMRTRE